MGVLNPRAICPNCGAKIHTQQSIWPGSKRTGTECPHCGVKLSGRVGALDNKAVLAGQQSGAEQVTALIGKGISAGGRAVKDRRDRRDQAAEAEAEVRGASAVIVQPTKKTLRLSVALRSAASGLDEKEKKALAREINAGRPITVEPGEQGDLKAFVGKLIKLGCEYELVRPEGSDSASESNADAKIVAPEPPTDEDSESGGPEPSSEASEDVLTQIEKLGQLHDAGVLTDEEFDAKKAELLERL
jgi:hypothetical protein